MRGSLGFLHLCVLCTLSHLALPTAAQSLVLGNPPDAQAPIALSAVRKLGTQDPLRDTVFDRIRKHAMEATLDINGRHVQPTIAKSERVTVLSRVFPITLDSNASVSPIPALPFNPSESVPSIPTGFVEPSTATSENGLQTLENLKTLKNLKNLKDTLSLSDSTKSANGESAVVPTPSEAASERPQNLTPPTPSPPTPPTPPNSPERDDSPKHAHPLSAQTGLRHAQFGKPGGVPGLMFRRRPPKLQRTDHEYL